MPFVIHLSAIKTKVRLSISLLCLLPLFNHAQPINGVTYKTEATSTYLHGNRVEDAPGGILIEFDGWIIRTTAKNQTKKLHLLGDWEEYVFPAKNRKNIRVQAKDEGGFKCLLNYGYDPDFEHYFLSILYDNVIFFHWMNPTDERISD